MVQSAHTELTLGSNEVIHGHMPGCSLLTLQASAECPAVSSDPAVDT